MKLIRRFKVWYWRRRLNECLSKSYRIPPNQDIPRQLLADRRYAMYRYESARKDVE